VVEDVVFAGSKGDSAGGGGGGGGEARPASRGGGASCGAPGIGRSPAAADDGPHEDIRDDDIPF